MNKQSIAIWALALSSILLLMACVFTGPRASAEVTVKDRDYQVATAHLIQGGEGLYVLDNRSGLMAVFLYDPAARGLRTGAVVPVPGLFR